MPMRLWFEHYSQHFRTLELSVTFYRFSQLSFLEKWYAQPDVQEAHLYFNNDIATSAIGNARQMLSLV